MARGSIEQIHLRAEAQRKTHAAGSIHLRDDDNGAIAQHREVAGLAGAMRDFVQERARVGDQALKRVTAMRELEQFQSQFKAIGRVGFADVAAAFEADEHAKDFADAAAEAAGNFRAGQAGGLGGEHFEDVETFIKGGCRVTAAGQGGAGVGACARKSSGHGAGEQDTSYFS